MRSGDARGDGSIGRKFASHVAALRWGMGAAMDLNRMSKGSRGIATLRAIIAAIIVAAGLGLGAAPSLASTLIVGARVVDGSGAPARTASVRIDGDRIVAVGDLAAMPADKVINAKGLVLAPGFIDAHSHHDRGQFSTRAMTPLLAQGVTTVVVGQDDIGAGPIRKVAAAFAARPASTNLASYTGHGHIRDEVMGKNYKRFATPQEVALMAALIDDDMAAGSLGLSTGLEYDPGIYSSHEEVLTLARTAARGGGRYISHMRSEDVRFDTALDELLEIGRKTGMPVQVSHIKLAMVDRWGDAKAVLARLDKARAEGINVTADVYPYEYWQSSLTVLLPERNFQDLNAARFALTQLTTPQGMMIASFAADPALVGRTIADIAGQRGEEPAVTYLSLIRQAEAWRTAHPDVKESVIGTAMAPQDVADFIAWPYAVICSDGFLGSRHPRGVGAFAKVLRLYVREQHRLSLETAIRKMTALTAESLGIVGRGQIRQGDFADLVLLDPGAISDHATPLKPQAVATGVSRVWVNGGLVYDNGRPTEVYAGRFVKRGGAH